jgi:glycosyltransferase involved in cell wall biosynthesis
MIRNEPPLIVHTDWSKSWGGQEIRTMTELREMRDKGFRCALVVPEQSELAKRGRDEGFTVCPVEFTSKFNISSWRALFRTLKKLKPAVVNTHSSEDSWMAGAVAKLCRVPLVLRTRHVLASISSAVSYNLFPHVVLACSEAIRDGLAAEGVSAGKIFVQPTGIDETRFQFSEENRRKIRAKYGIKDNEILVGNVGFLRIYKGQIFIVRTAAAMPDNYKFMLVGDGQDMPILQAEVEKLGVKDRFIFAGHQERPEDFFPAFDILFFSSWETEGIAQSFIQGLLYGLPLLVCRTPSILEPLSCVQTYRLIDYNDLQAACSGLTYLSDYLQRDEEKVKQQRLAISSKYGLKTMMNNLLEIYSRHGVKVDS